MTTTAGRPLRVAVYKRISRDKEGRELGVKRQDADCKAFVAEHADWVLAEEDVYCDNDISASTLSTKPRPDFERMMAKAWAGELDVLVSYTNSRFTRRPSEVEILIQLHDKRGVKLHTLRSGSDDLSTADGRMVARLKAAVDAAEPERAQERVIRKLKERVDEKLPHNAQPRLGYIVRDKRYFVDENLREIVKSAYERFAAGLVDMAELAAEFNAAGIPSLRGAGWHDYNLRRSLDTGFAAGLIRERSEGNTSRRIDAYDKIRIGAHEPIITKKTWDEYKARRLANNKQTERKRAGSEHALSGLLVCGACTRHDPVKLGAVSINKKRAWRCPEWARSPKGNRVHAHFVTYDTLVETLILDWIERNIEGGDDVAERATKIAKAQRAQGDVVRLESQIETLKLERREIARQASKGVYSDEDAISLREDKEAEIAKAEAELAKAQAEASAPVLDHLKAFTTLRDEWPRFTPREKREALSKVLDYVVVHPPKRKGGKATLKVLGK